MKASMFAWPDVALAGAAVVWLAAGARMELFHYFVLAVMSAVLVLGLRRGLRPALVRTAAVSALVAAIGLWRGLGAGVLAADLASVSGCGLLAGFLGDGQRRARIALTESFRRTLEILSRTLEVRDPYTEGHSRRTALYADAIAEALGLGREARERLRWAALLHDLGKIGVPDALLHKTSGLTDEERHRMAEHPKIGAGIIAGLPFLKEAANLVLHHHERFDGAGTPGGLAGDAIPLEARILTTADALDALTTDRPYRQAIGWEDARLELEKESGTRFDPRVLAVLRWLPLGSVPGSAGSKSPIDQSAGTTVFLRRASPMKIALLAFICFGVLASDGIGAPLTLSEYLDQVAASNPAIQAARSRARAGAARVGPASALDDPFIAAGIDQVPVSGPDMESVTRYQVSQSVPFPGKRSARRRAAENRAVSFTSDEETVRRMALVEAEQVFLRIYYNRHAADWNMRLSGLVVGLGESAKSRYKTGEGTHHDWLLSKLEASILSVEALKLARERKTLAAQLNALRGAPAEEPVEPAAVNFQAGTAVAQDPLADQPELKALEAVVGAADAQRREAKLSFLPDFVFQGMAMTPRADKSMKGEWGAMVGLNLPIFFYKKQAGLLSAAKNEKEAALADREALRNGLAAELVDAQEQRRTASDIVRLYEEEIIPVTRIAAKNSEKAYASKRAALSEFIEILKTQRTQELELLAAKIDRQLAATRINRLLSAPPLLRLAPARPSLFGSGMGGSGMGVSGDAGMGRGMKAPRSSPSKGAPASESSGMGGMK